MKTTFARRRERGAYHVSQKEMGTFINASEAAAKCFAVAKKKAARAGAAFFFSAI
jgi:hypothetical protein